MRSEQEVIDSVTAMGCVVVASAGNNATTADVYPASYRNTISVGSVRADMSPSIFTNRSTEIDIVAPGDDIISTAPVGPSGEGGYRVARGTSMSAPIVSATAALVALRFPELSPEEIAAVLCSTADGLYKEQSALRYMLGSGRVNVMRALSQGDNGRWGTITLDAIEEEIPDGIFNPGEMLDIRFSVNNILGDLDSAWIEVRPAEGTIAAFDSVSVSLGSIASGTSVHLQAGVVRIRVPESIAFDTSLSVEITLYEANQQAGGHRFILHVNPLWATTSGNRIAATYSGNGRIGFNDFPYNRRGNGFKLDSSASLIAEGGLLVGVSPAAIADVVRGSSLLVPNNAINAIEPYRTSQGLQGETGHAVMRPIFSGGPDLPQLEIDLRTEQYITPDLDRSVLLYYTVSNAGTSIINGVYLGIYLDGDISYAGQRDSAAIDLEHRMGYIWQADDALSPLVGAMLVSNETMNFEALDTRREPIASGWQLGEKWMSVSGGIRREQSGSGDVSMVIGAGGFSLEPGEHRTVVFAMMAGSNLNELRATAKAASGRIAADGITPGGPITLPRLLSMSDPVPNPFHDVTSFEYSIPSEGDVRIEVFTPLGERVVTLAEGYRPKGIHTARFSPEEMGLPVASGVYYIRISVGEDVISRNVVRLEE